MIGCQRGNKIPDGSAHLLAAKEALEQGDKGLALSELDLSLAAEPSVWAYALRGRLHAEAGNDELAEQDCQAGLELENNNYEIRWLMEELKKPPAKRFQTEAPMPSK